MAAHNELGRKGEDAAVAKLMAEGYAVRHRNWRCGHKELDIVAERDGMLVFVEVKTRRDVCFGRPEEAVTPLKIRRIVASADAYLRKFALDQPVRFDVVTVVEDTSGRLCVHHIEEAFYPPLF
ncbi:MAG: YraN family protein [Clostridium sp.]|nr:YraN family protein [Clostridium sp.]